MAHVKIMGRELEWVKVTGEAMSCSQNDLWLQQCSRQDVEGNMAQSNATLANPPQAIDRPLWKSRKVLGIAGLLLMVLVVRLAWGWWVGRELEGIVGDLRKAGQPVTPAEVNFEQVPDEENAFWVEQQAFKAIAFTDSPSNSSLDYAGYSPFPPEWHKLAEQSEKANAAMFPLMRQARGFKRVQLRQNLSSPMIAILLPYLNNLKLLANTERDGAIYAHLKGDDAEALERVRDMLHLGWMLRHDDFVVSQLVAMGIDAVSYETLEVIAPGLQLKNGPATRPATEAQVRDLIAYLLNEQGLQEGMARSMRIERVAAIDWVQWASREVWVVRPLADRQLIRTIPRYALWEEAARARSAVEARRIAQRTDMETVEQTPILVLSSARANGGPIPRYSRWFQVHNTLGPAIERNFRALAERRICAVNLACQLYRADRGHYPQALAELVPKYLPAIPVDPFSAEGAPIGYVIIKRKGRERPLLFFEAGDKNVPLRPTPMYGWQIDPRMGTKQFSGDIRQYRDLTRF